MLRGEGREAEKREEKSIEMLRGNERRGEKEYGEEVREGKKAWRKSVTGGESKREKGRRGIHSLR